METQTQTRLQPLHDKVVIRVIEKSDKTETGIYLPDTAQKKPTEGVVLAVGPGKSCEAAVAYGAIVPLTVKVGDNVLFSRYGGTEVTVDGEELTILSEDQIYAILKA